MANGFVKQLTLFLKNFVLTTHDGAVKYLENSDQMQKSVVFTNKPLDKKGIVMALCADSGPQQ